MDGPATSAASATPWKPPRRGATRGRDGATSFALPHQLTSDRRVALVDRYCEWLLKQYGVASAACIHAPPCHAKRRTRTKGHGHGDPRNWHVHVIASTRRLDTGAQIFGEKARELDDIRDGPRELERQRAEWARRATEALREAGENVVVDLRSYERRTAAGDVPPGLVPQRHAGPARTAISRAQEDRTGLPQGATFERHLVSEKNDEPWHLWAGLREVDRAIALDEEAMRRAATTDDRAKAAGKTKLEPRPIVISAAELCPTVSERRLPRRTCIARSGTDGSEPRRPAADGEGNLVLDPLGPAAGTERRRTVEAMPASAADRRVDPRRPDVRDDAERIAAAAAAMAPSAEAASAFAAFLAGGRPPSDGEPGAVADDPDLDLEGDDIGLPPDLRTPRSPDFPIRVRRVVRGDRDRGRG